MAEGSVVKQSALRTAMAGLIGNVLEWFDFAVYGYFASNIGHQFFPKADPTVQTFSPSRLSRWASSPGRSAASFSAVSAIASAAGHC